MPRLNSTAKLIPAIQLYSYCVMFCNIPQALLHKSLIKRTLPRPGKISTESWLRKLAGLSDIVKMAIFNSITSNQALTGNAVHKYSVENFRRLQTRAIVTVKLRYCY